MWYVLTSGFHFIIRVHLTSADRAEYPAPVATWNFESTRIIIIIELTHSKTILEIIVKIEPQPAALDFKNLSQYSSCSK